MAFRYAALQQCYGGISLQYSYCYWKSFTIDEMIDLAEKTGFTFMDVKEV